MHYCFFSRPAKVSADSAPLAFPKGTTRNLLTNAGVQSARLAAVEAAYIALKRKLEHRAAVAIQTRFRAYQARKLLLVQRRAALTIQVRLRHSATLAACTATMQGAQQCASH